MIKLKIEPLRLRRYLISISLAIILFPVIGFILLWIANTIYLQLLPRTQVNYGITFSPIYAQSLGLDPFELYRDILSDLKVKNLRIPVYWDSSEPVEGNFDFSTTDKLLDIAQKENAKVILAIGYKVPRWPECFEPKWAVLLDQTTYNQKLITYLTQVISHFKDRPGIIAWQVENEPLYDFGVCKAGDPQLLFQEVSLVRKLDKRPIIMTQSGEVRVGNIETALADKVGTSLYRRVWNPQLGYIEYPIPPIFYPLKAYLVKTIFAPNSQGTLISELQAEPWPAGTSLTETPIPEQINIFSLDDFKRVISYAQGTGFNEQYLWGVEWWYFMKHQGYPQYWEYAKSLF